MCIRDRLGVELGSASLLGLLGLLTLVIDVNAYLFIAVAVTYLFFRYLLIVVLGHLCSRWPPKMGGVPEAEVVQNRQFISTLHCEAMRQPKMMQTV